MRRFGLSNRLKINHTCRFVQKLCNRSSIGHKIQAQFVALTDSIPSFRAQADRSVSDPHAS